MKIDGLGPRAVQLQERGKSRGNGNHMGRLVVILGVAEAGKDVGALGPEPLGGCGVVGEIRYGSGGYRPWPVSWASVSGQVSVGSGGGVSVVVQQLFDGPCSLIGRVAGRVAAGVLGDQVVHVVALIALFDEQVMAEEGLEVVAGLGQGQPRQRRSSIGVELDAGMKAQGAEEALLVGGQMPVRQVERGRQGLMFETDGQQSRRRLVDQVGYCPLPVLLEQPCHEANGQRQMFAQSHHVGDSIGTIRGAGGQPQEQPCGVIGRQRVQRHVDRLGRQVAETAAAGDQDQAVG
jgi:hypothetical protein